ncbi:hypothetical protein FMEAI12_3260004 [Parafrankia sp. Ea1.12]|nr:hypothetical protein FMEAI12_3260004 [Parafrankia sp. Ea1.12]
MLMGRAEGTCRQARYSCPTSDAFRRARAGCHSIAVRPCRAPSVADQASNERLAQPAHEAPNPGASDERTGCSGIGPSARS